MRHLLEICVNTHILFDILAYWYVTFKYSTCQPAYVVLFIEILELLRIGCKDTHLLSLFLLLLLFTILRNIFFLARVCHEKENKKHKHNKEKEMEIKFAKSQYPSGSWNRVDWPLVIILCFWMCTIVNEMDFIFVCANFKSEWMVRYNRIYECVSQSVFRY